MIFIPHGGRVNEPALTAEFLLELTEQSYGAQLEFDPYNGFRSGPDAMKYLTAATVFSQPLPNLKEATRQIVYFDPDFDTQIGWGAG